MGFYSRDIAAMRRAKGSTGTIRYAVQARSTRVKPGASRCRAGLEIVRDSPLKGLFACFAR